MRRTRGSVVFVEVVRLAIVLLLTAAGYVLGPAMAGLWSGVDAETVTLVSTVLGALVGYVLGGATGRGVVEGVDRAEERLRRVEAAVLVSAVLGAALLGIVGLLLLWPVLLLPGQIFTVPIAAILLVVLVYTGGRLGVSRGGDLMRFLGARGRLEVTSPSRGYGTKLVDTSALVDGRIVAVARAGFLEGTLVIPRFVLDEMQRLADTADARRRNAGRRGLDALQVLQDEALVGVEVTDDDAPGVAEVDAKLAALARERHAALVTVDANLASVAEISGVRVLNLHVLAEAMRPPVIPGDRFQVNLVREGTEPRQAVGYLADGTMVVVEKAVESVGDRVTVEVTSLLQTRNGRMVFADLADADG